LEEFARRGVQQLLQRLLEEEVEEVLGAGGISGVRSSTRPV
jgi:hypothetical protein